MGWGYDRWQQWSPVSVISCQPPYFLNISLRLKILKPRGGSALAHMRPRSVPGSKHFGQRNVMKINDLSFWKWPYMAERGRETAKQASVLSWTVKNFLQSPDWPLSVPHAFSSFKLWWKGRVKPCFVTQEKSRQHSMQGGQHLSECFYWFLWLHKLKNVEAYHKNWKLLHTVLVVNFRFSQENAFITLSFSLLSR